MPDNVAAEIPAFEAVWLARVRILAGEAYAALRLVSALCSDKLTVRAIAHGDPAARTEIVRAFRLLSDLRRRYVDEFEPPPLRFHSFAQIVGRAFTELSTAAIAFERSIEPVVDFNGFGIVSEHLAEGGRLIALIAKEPTAEPAPAPPPARKPRRRSAALND